MRIIAGSARGRRLVAPAGETTRPTSDRLRESLFSILASRVDGARVLDLFGGTGALALEAVSRGASEAAIVDVDRRAIEAIRKNAVAVLGEAYGTRIRVIQSDYRRAIDALTGNFDLVFLDPPYHLRESYADAIGRLDARGRIAQDAVIVCERAKEAPPIAAQGFCAYDERMYGDTAVDFLRRES